MNVFLKDLLEFDSTHEAETAFYYANIILCIDMNMMFDLEVRRRVPKHVYRQMFAENKIKAYSVNSQHPVFGDMKLYKEVIGPEVVKFGSELSLLLINMPAILDDEETLRNEFAQHLTMISKELLFAISVYPRMRTTMSQRWIWEEIIRFDKAVRNDETPTVPYMHLMRTHLIFHNDLYEEDITAQGYPLGDDTLLFSHVERIANEQRFGKEVEVDLLQGLHVHRFKVSPGVDVEYDIKRV